MNSTALSNQADEKPNALDFERNGDVEVGKKTEKSLENVTQDANVISWTDENDTENPKNWTLQKKWITTIVVSSFTFITPVSSSMLAPALFKISQDLNISTDIEIQLVFSTFILAYAIGPLFMGPLSETYGRVWVLQLANSFYFIFNLACGFAQSEVQMIVFRFLSGLGGSAPLAVGGGVLSDCWNADERGKAVGIYSLVLLLGPAIGPIAGGFIAEYTTWRWVFWSTCITDALIQICGLFLLDETYAPVLLERRARHLRAKTGNQRLHSAFASDNTILQTLGISIVRPFRMLATQPIIQLSTFPGVWQSVYGESAAIGGLNYLSLGLGFAGGAQINARLNDNIYQRLKHRNNGVGRPEFRIPLMVVASALLPIGLFWYGWSAQAHAHWIMPNIGMFIFSLGCVICLQCMQIYVIDSYARFAASGLAAAVVLRSIAGFAFPLFAPAMYDALGYGWGSSILGFVGVVIGMPAPFLFWIYGEKLRTKSPYAAG